MKTKTFILLLISALALFSCNNGNGSNTNPPNNPPESEEDKIVNELIAQCKAFSAEDIMLNLLGTWKNDSMLIYDETWEHIIEMYMFFGKYYSYGGYAGDSDGTKFYFSADGKGEYCFTWPYPPYEDDSLSFDWNFDATSNRLVLSGEYTLSATVSGFNNEYIILDNVSAENKNYRRILKKVVE